jgi:hypothetical protein
LAQKSVSHSKPMREKKLKKDIKIRISETDYFLYEIIWEDIVGDSSIQSLDEALRLRTATIKTIAFILKKDKKYLYTFASYSQDGFYGDRNIIPLGVVKSIHKITP